MSPKVLHRPLELLFSDLQQLQQRPLIYHFFEIVQILDGSGVRLVNDNRYAYTKGTVFLFTPHDCRGFESTTPTRFCSIRFSAGFLGQCRSEADRARIAEWLKRLEHIFYHHNRFHPLRLNQPGDEALVTSLIISLTQEYERGLPNHEENLQHLVTLLLNVIARNVAQTCATVTFHESSEPLIGRLLRHLHENIGAPEKLRIRYLAKSFHLSPTYLGEYFRKFTGENLQRYLTNYRVGLVKQRLINSDLTISQIAAELGYTDESHLNRQFRNSVGKSPGAFRKTNAAAG